MEIPPRPMLQLLSHRPERQNQNTRYLMISGTSKRTLGTKVSHRVEWRPVWSKKEIKTGTEEGANSMARMWGEYLEIKGRDGPGQIQKSCSHHRRGQGCKAKG